MLTDASGIDGYDVPGSLRCERIAERASSGETFNVGKCEPALRGSRGC